MTINVQYPKPKIQTENWYLLLLSLRVLSLWCYSFISFRILILIQFTVLCCLLLLVVHIKIVDRVGCCLRVSCFCVCVLVLFAIIFLLLVLRAPFKHFRHTSHSMRFDSRCVDGVNIVFIATKSQHWTWTTYTLAIFPQKWGSVSRKFTALSKSQLSKQFTFIKWKI